MVPVVSSYFIIGVWSHWLLIENSFSAQLDSKSRILHKLYPDCLHPKKLTDKKQKKRGLTIKGGSVLQIASFLYYLYFINQKIHSSTIT